MPTQLALLPEYLVLGLATRKFALNSRYVMSALAKNAAPLGTNEPYPVTSVETVSCLILDGGRRR